MKVVNDLLGYKNLKIVQDTSFFSFSFDSVLLPNFVSLNNSVKNILDIGTGNAPIPLILSRKTNANIYAIEIQKEVYDLAKETLEINNLDNRINLINDDVKNLNKYFKNEFFDVITCNPPYFKYEKTSKLNDVNIKSIARHEIKLDLDSLMNISFKYLKNNGILAMIHRTDRLAEILSVMRSNRIEPKRILFIYPKIGKFSNLFLVEGVKNANSGIISVDQLIAHNPDGSYTADVLKYFE